MFRYWAHGAYLKTWSWSVKRRLRVDIVLSVVLSLFLLFCHCFNLYLLLILNRSTTGQSLNVQYGPGSGQIWLDNVQCLGSETDLVDCVHDGWGIHNCNHTFDVSISCNGNNRSSLRRKLGSNTYIGKISQNNHQVINQSVNKSIDQSINQSSTCLTRYSQFSLVCHTYWTMGGEGICHGGKNLWKMRVMNVEWNRVGLGPRSDGCI